MFLLFCAGWKSGWLSEKGAGAHSVPAIPKLFDGNHTQRAPRSYNSVPIEICQQFSFLGHTRPNALIKTQNLPNHISIDALRIEPLSNSIEATEVLYLVSKDTPVSPVRTLTFGSRFLTDRLNTSRVFLVQCGRHGNSSMSVLATLWSLAMVSPIPTLNKVSHLQNCSLNRLWSPIVGRNDGKSNMIAPLLQSAPSVVLYVTWPRRSK